MWSNPNRALRLALLAAGLAPLAWPASAQSKGDDPSLVYRREVFQYPRGARPDPFRSLLTPEELGYRVEDMRLTGVIYSPNSQVSVAVLTDALSKKRFRLRVGERVGGITVAAIHPRRVDVVVNEFGVIRRETLQLRRPDPVQEATGPQQQAQGAIPAVPAGSPVQNAAQNGRGK
ncbi:MAG TPA: hypothetical protein VGR37_00585 [Longimicrobiaceae bacterium]|nr:hypothetical protein [Longimicrobiaceae bacterium]